MRACGREQLSDPSRAPAGVVTPASAELLSIPGLDPEEDAAQLLAHLQTNTHGLDEREAARRLLQFGANEIRRDDGPPWWRSLLDQFTHPLALLLWVAAGAVARHRRARARGRRSSW